MAAVDGKRSASAFQHQFRKVKARAKELQEQTYSGGLPAGTPVKKTKSTASTPASKGRKRGKKAASEMEGEGEDDVEPQAKKAKKADEIKAEESGDEL